MPIIAGRRHNGGPSLFHSDELIFFDFLALSVIRLFEMARFRCMLAFSTAILLCSAYSALAQNSEPAPESEKQLPSKQQTSGLALPDPYKLNMMIRSAIIALNQANKTGNYTVLQDLGAPSFRASNNSARLAQIFADLRQRNRDLSPILFFTPKLARQPHINRNGILRLVGYFPTAPERVNFDLYFQMTRGDWRIFGIGVATTPAEVTAALAPQKIEQAGRANLRNEKAPVNKTSHVEDKPDAASSKASAGQRTVKVGDAPLPGKKPQRQTPPLKTDDHNAPEGARSVVKNGTTNNATRIDLSQMRLGSRGGPEEEPSGSSADSGASGNNSSLWDSLNPFSDH